MVTCAARNLLIIAGVLLTLGGRALAADVRPDCDSAWTLETELSLSDRTWLHALCMQSASASSRLAVEWHGERRFRPGSDAARLADIVSQLAPYGGYTASVLRRVLPTGLMDQRSTYDLRKVPGSCKASESTTAEGQDPLWAALLANPTASPIDQKHKDKKSSEAPAAAGFPRALDAYIQERIAGDPVTRVPTREPLSPGGCWKELVDQANDSRPFLEDCASSSASAPNSMRHCRAPDYVLLSLVGLKGDDVTLAYGGSTPDVLVLRSAGEIRGRHVFIAMVPKNVPIAISVTRGQDVLVFRSTSGQDQPFWLENEEPSCVDLRIASGPGSAIYLDGVRVDVKPNGGLPGPARIRYVERSTHHLVVLGAREARAAVPPILLMDTIAADTLFPHVCAAIERDLTRKVFANAIGVLDIRTESDCAAAGIDRARLKLHTLSFLRSTAPVVRDLDALGSVVRGLSELREVVSALGTGRAIGADRGRMDVDVLASSGAKELVRQGFARVISVEVFCSRSSGLGGFGYSIAARQLDLDLLVSQPRDPLTGVPLDGMLRTEIETIEKVTGLRPALLAALARLMGSPYARLIAAPEKVRYRDTIDFDVEAYDPGPAAQFPAPTSKGPRRLEIAIRRLDSGDRSFCDRFTSLGALRSSMSPKDVEGGEWRVVQSQALESKPEPQVVAASTNATTTGLHVLAARVMQGKRVVGPISYSCVDVTEASSKWWLDATVMPWSIQLRNDIEAARPESYQSWLLTTGVTWPGLPFGFVGGYFNASRKGTTPPTWDDFRSPAFTPQGVAPYSVSEQGFLAGLAIVAPDLDLCRTSGICGAFVRRFGVLARMLVFFDGSLANVSSSAPLNAFGDDKVHFDFGFAAQAGLRVHVLGPIASVLAFSFGTLHLLDLWSWPNEGVRSASFDGRLLLGMNFGVQGDL